MTPHRFDIVLVNLDPVIGSEMAKKRPAVVVSASEMNAALDTVVVCPLTTKLHPGWRSDKPRSFQRRDRSRKPAALAGSSVHRG